MYVTVLKRGEADMICYNVNCFKAHTQGGAHPGG